MRNDKYYENPKTYNEFKHNQNVAELRLQAAEKKLDTILTVKGNLIIYTKSGPGYADPARYQRLEKKTVETRKEIKFLYKFVRKVLETILFSFFSFFKKAGIESYLFFYIVFILIIFRATRVLLIILFILLTLT